MKRSKSQVMLSLLLFVVIYLRTVAASSAGFVQVAGTEFSLDGEPFYFAGANCYYAWYGRWDSPPRDANNGYSREVLDDAAAMGLRVLRVWGFSDGYHYWGSLQYEKGQYNEAAFRLYDRLIKEAGDRGIRLIIPLVNNWPAYGGMSQYNAWCGLSSHDEFYSNACTKLAYKAYLNYIVNRVNTLTGVKYKDDPTIMAWELANEPRARSDTSGALLNSWIGEMSVYLKSVDSNHLVSTGIEGGYQDKGTNPSAWWYKGNEGQDFLANHQWSTIDFATYHYYRAMDATLDPLVWIREHIRDAHDVLGKPIVLGEFGAPDPKEAKFAAWYKVMEEEGINGDCLWMLKDSAYPDFDGYSVDYPEDAALVDIIEDHAYIMNVWDGVPPPAYTGRMDLAVYHQAKGDWHISRSQDGYVKKQFGWREASPVPADYDGDGKTDLAVFHPAKGEWHILRTQDGFVKRQLGWKDVVPVPADYDGDGKDDVAVYHPAKGNWYILRSQDGFIKRQLGWKDAAPVPADYDGDGKDDVAVYHPAKGNWYILRSQDGFIKRQLGWKDAAPVPADYDGDNKADVAVYHQVKGNWYILRSQDGFIKRQLGWHQTDPYPMDSDGDGKADLVVLNRARSRWHFLQSRDGYAEKKFGWSIPEPVPADYDGDYVVTP